MQVTGSTTRSVAARAITTGRPARYETEADATKALRLAMLASLRGPHAEGYRCARFKIAPVLAAVACLVLQ